MGRVKTMIIEWTLPMMSVLYMASVVPSGPLHGLGVSMFSLHFLPHKQVTVMCAPAGYDCDHVFSPTEGNSVCSTKWPSNVPGFLPLLHNSAQR